MSKYTTELRYICEVNSGFKTEELDGKSVDDIVKASRKNIFNFSYPIYDESHRAELECKILKHYYTREIAAETFGLWRLWLNSTMNEIMPKYNKLYEYEKLAYDKAFNNIDVYDDGTSEFSNERNDKFVTNEVGSDAGSSSVRDKKRFSDTPQGSVTFNETNNENYWLTDYTEVDSDRTYNDSNNRNIRNNGVVTNEGDGATTNHEYGYRGGRIKAELLNELEKKYLNIDLMIINDLKDLFFKLW